MNDGQKTFRIFRAKDAPGLFEAGCMKIEPIPAEHRASAAKAVEAGYMKGEEVKVLVDLPGYSVIYAWFKKNYPLMRHSHDADCLYFVIAGSIRLGTEDLGPRDCVFVPAGVPYTFKPGPDGAEFIEFRHNGQFNFLSHSNTEAFWEKAARTVRENVADWETARPPSELTTATA